MIRIQNIGRYLFTWGNNTKKRTSTNPKIALTSLRLDTDTTGMRDDIPRITEYFSILENRTVTFNREENWWRGEV